MNKRQQDFIKRELVDRDVVVLVLSDGRKRRLQRSGFCRYVSCGPLKRVINHLPTAGRSCWLPSTIFDVQRPSVDGDLSYAITRMAEYDKREDLNLVGVYTASGRLIKRFT